MKILQYRNTYCECCLAEPNQGKAIIVLGGIPGVPKNNENITNTYLKKGYNIFYPHYEGTWKSEGVFLERPPSEAIDEFLKYLHSETDWASSIEILASSFGGYVALSLNDSSYIHSVFVMSPVVSFQQVLGMETLEKYILETYPDDYRFIHKGWENMLNDTLKSPIHGMSLPPDKIVIVAGINDVQIAVDDLGLFAENYKIKNFHALDLPHITFSKMSEEVNSLLDETFLNLK